jgi:glycosyltransferase involved in cell wall biosynthesis
MSSTHGDREGTMGEPETTVLLVAGHLGPGGEGRSILALLDLLEQRGVAAQVVCLSVSAAAATDLRILEYPALSRQWLRLFAARRLHALEGLRRPGLIHVTEAELAPIGLAIAESWQIPYIQTVDEFLAPGGRLRLSRSWCWKLVATSRELADDLIARVGVSDDFVNVAPRSIEIPEEAAIPEASPSIPVIGTINSLVPARGVATFLEAARRVLDAGIDAEFLISGQRHDEDGLRLRGQQLRIADRVTFDAGPLAGSHFWSVLNVFCLTPQIPTEGHQLAQALAFGVPTVISDVAGLRGLVSHGETGLRVPPEDPKSLAEAILDLLHRPEYARKLGRNGRAVVRREFDLNIEAETLDAIYRSALATGAFRECSANSPVLVTEPRN